jgi:hypothetical protein
MSEKEACWCCQLTRIRAGLERLGKAEQGLQIRNLKSQILNKIQIPMLKNNQSLWILNLGLVWNLGFEICSFGFTGGLGGLPRRETTPSQRGCGKGGETGWI